MNVLITLTLCGSLAALLLLLLRYAILRKMPSSVYYYLWLLVLLRFAVPLPGLVSWEHPAGESEVVPISAPAEPTEARPEREPVELPTPSALPTVPVTARTNDLPAAAGAKRVSVDWKDPTLWLWVWRIGTAVSLAFYVGSYLVYSTRLRGRLRSAAASDRLIYAALKGRKPRLYRSDAIRTPMTFGLLHPIIVLPDVSYDDETLTNVLRHELLHHRRRDILYKWLAVPVYAAQWFNPLAYVMRREINRACELSCDEMLLRGMSGSEKRSYGNTLLSMAAHSALPAGIAATSFSTEKKNLKERLEQIMHYKKSGIRILAALLAVLIMAGCTAAVGPKTEPTPEPTPSAAPSSAPITEEDSVEGVEVHSVDELLSAIGNNAVIRLGSGDYDLSAASDYGKESKNPCYRWDKVYDGYELVVYGVSDLQLLADGATISSVPRYANVLRLEDCEKITLRGFTAGHTVEPGWCVGGVIYLQSCRQAEIRECRLYGCGVIGVQTVGCEDVSVYGSDIYACSYMAASADNCRELRFDHCRFYDFEEADTLFRFESSDCVSVSECEIFNCKVQRLMMPGSSTNVYFTGNSVHNCTFLSAVFSLARNDDVVDACEFRDCSIITWFEGAHPVNAKGEELNKEDMLEMVLGEASQPSPAPVLPAVDPDAEGVYRVSTVDELLGAIGSNRMILLAAGTYDLSTASDYGSYGGECYHWRENYDGPELVIEGVENLTICSDAAPGECTVSAVPRYANVLYCESCTGLQLIGITFGHTVEPGSCSGGVIFLQNCLDTAIYDCRLYGCGILGVEANNSAGLLVSDTEIFECSQGAVHLSFVDRADFTNCRYYDLGGYAFTLHRCEDVTVETVSLDDGVYDIVDGKPTEIMPNQ